MSRFFTIWALGALMALAAVKAVLADETPAKHPDAQSGTPLSYYCLHVPDLSVDRPGSVETWVKICTVYFNATADTKTKQPAAKPEKAEKQKTEKQKTEKAEKPPR